MAKSISQLTDEERSKLFPIILKNHNLKWKQWYVDEKNKLLKNVDQIIDIHHYGSTAIPNIMAKPTVDILIEADKSADLEKLKKEIVNIGYTYMNYGKEPSLTFVKGYTINGFADKVFHLHVHYKGIQEELIFRDYLKEHHEAAKEYEKLKQKLKEKYEFDRDAYTDSKGEFIKSIVKKALSEKIY